MLIYLIIQKETVEIPKICFSNRIDFTFKIMIAMLLHLINGISVSISLSIKRQYFVVSI